jgi:tetratricopeptide (TPR) repeat protein
VAIAALLVIGVSGCAALRRNAVSENVVEARQMSLRGMDALQQGKSDVAESCFATAIRANPADERAHVQYAELLWQRGAHDDAISHLERSIKLSGEDPALLVRLGEMYLARGYVDRAWRQAEQAIQANRQLACAWALRGDIHRQRGELNEALNAYHRSLSYEGQCPHVQLAVTAIYREQNRPQRALSTLEHLAQNYAPSEVPTELLVEQGLALKALGRFEDAADKLALAARQPQASPEILYHLGEARLLAGDLANARLAVAAALSIEPHHPACRDLQGRIDHQQQTLTASLK